MEKKIDDLFTYLYDEVWKIETHMEWDRKCYEYVRDQFKGGMYWAEDGESRALMPSSKEEAILCEQDLRTGIAMKFGKLDMIKQISLDMGWKFNKYPQK